MLLYLLLALFGASFIPQVREFLKPKMKWISLIVGILFTLIQLLIVFIMTPYITSLQKDFSTSPNSFILPSEILGILSSILLIANYSLGERVAKGNVLFYGTFALLFIAIISFAFETLAVVTGIYQFTSTY